MRTLLVQRAKSEQLAHRSSRSARNQSAPPLLEQWRVRDGELAQA
jgi:hypothetical protein